MNGSDIDAQIAWHAIHDAHRDRQTVTVALIDGREFTGPVVEIAGDRSGSFTLDVLGTPTVIGWRYVRTVRTEHTGVAS